MIGGITRDEALRQAQPGSRQAVAPGGGPSLPLSQALVIPPPKRFSAARHSRM